MHTKDEITQIFAETAAKVFQKDTEYFSNHLDLNFKKDLHASSMQYFPFVVACEEKLDLEISFHELEMCKTIADAIDFIDKQINS